MSDFPPHVKENTPAEGAPVQQLEDKDIVCFCWGYDLSFCKCVVYQSLLLFVFLCDIKNAFHRARH